MWIENVKNSDSQSKKMINNRQIQREATFTIDESLFTPVEKMPNISRSSASQTNRSAFVPSF